MKIIPLVAVATHLLLQTAQARTWQILEDGSGDAPTVQAGIDSAAVGDTVLVGPGTYLEHPNFLGKEIVLKSEMGPEVTTLDGSLGTFPWVVAFRSGETAQAFLVGFTITGGLGGVSVRDSEASIVGNVIMANIGAGGILTSTSSNPGTPLQLVIRDNLIRENTASQGGGIDISGFFVPKIINNMFLENEVTFGDGGGISLVSAAPGAQIIGNHFEGNIAADHGGGMYVGCSIPGPSGFEVAYNIVVSNVANGRAPDLQAGGGIWVGAADAWLHHNTIVANSGDEDATGSGGGIALVMAGTPILEQNIIAFSRPTGKGLACQQTTPILRNNLAWANQPEDLDPVCAGYWADNGNIIADPDFCGWESGDFSLGKNSPAMTHPAGPLGALPDPGCTGMTPTLPSTWGQLKTRYIRPR